VIIPSQSNVTPIPPDPIDPRVQSQLDELRNRIEVLERWADRKE
jgi:hypothetical protein